MKLNRYIYTLIVTFYNLSTMFNTSNSNNYEYTTKHLELHILGGIKTNKLESLRITLSIQKLKQENILRHTIDLYNDNQVEKFVRKVAER